MKQISVIIPTYNRGHLIFRAIDSVLKQSYNNYEIIVIDDGSTDNTVDIIKKHYKKKVIYKQIPQSGVSRARNEGIKLSTGNWIAFLDSDDIWLPKKLEKQIQYLNYNNQFLTCHTDEIWIKNELRINQSKKHKKYAGDFFLPSLRMCLISPSSIMVQKDIFKDIGKFDETFAYVEDYEMWLRLTSKYDIGYINEKLVIKFGGHDDQLSKSIHGIEKFRMIALEKFIKNNYQDESMLDYVWNAFLEYKRKYKIYRLGCIKRDKIKELKDLERTFNAIKLLLNNHNLPKKKYALSEP